VSQFRTRRSYAADPALCNRVFELLDTWLPSLSTQRRQAEALDWRWQQCSTPFVAERDGRILSHVGVLETHWVCRGVEHCVGGVHAVCTLAAERRRGLYRGLMEEVLAHCDARYETVKLWTENPEYYEPFGFRVIPEHRFRLRVEPRPGRSGFRSIDLGRASERKRIDRLLATRTPVSDILGVVRDHDLFKFNLAGGPLHYCEELDLLAVVRRRNGRLQIDDLIGRELPDLPDLLSQIGDPVDEVVFHFRPDRLGVDAPAEPVRYDGDVLMVRGPFPLDSATGASPIEFMLPPLARH
jgi:GNAT superfamily N-acetyltransferase